MSAICCETAMILKKYPATRASENWTQNGQLTDFNTCADTRELSSQDIAANKA